MMATVGPRHPRPRLRWGPLVGALLLVALTLLAVAGPTLPLPDPMVTATEARLRPPDGLHVLGTDGLGRDVASRFVAGTRVALTIGILSAGLAALVGGTLGLIAGYRRGPLDHMLTRLADLQLSLPSLVLVVSLVAALGPGLGNVIIALSVSGWIPYARLARAETLSLRARDSTVAARALGASDIRIARCHILPSLMPGLATLASAQIPQLILAEAGLSFLGLGIAPPEPTWGNMVADGRAYFPNAWWISTFPGLALTLTALAVSLISEWWADDEQGP